MADERIAHIGGGPAPAEAQPPAAPSSPGRAGSEEFATQLRAARTLIAFIARTGREVDKTAIKTVIEADAAFAKGALSPDMEGRFWVAFNTLAQAARPATLATVYATEGSGDPRTLWDLVAPMRAWGGWMHRADADHPRRTASAAQRVVGHFRSLTAIALGCALVFQIYFLFASSVTERIEDGRTRIRDLGNEVTVIDNSLSSLDAELRRIAEQGSRSGPSAGSDLVARRLEISQSMDALRTEKISKNSLRNYYSQNLTSDYKLLDYFIPFYSLDSPGEANITLQLQQSLNAIVLEYFLPLFIGMLGACASILQKISRDIENVTLSPGGTVNYSLRVYLGMIAGLAIVWLFRDWFAPSEEAGLLGQTSPLALAFIAGYSVELVFSLLDGVISAFSVRGGGRGSGS